MEEQGLDVGLGAGLVAVLGLDRGPVPVMGGGGYAGLAGLDQGGRRRQCPGFIGQHLQVVVQDERGRTPDGGTLMSGDQPWPVVDQHVGGTQQHPHPAGPRTGRAPSTGTAAP